MLRRSLALVVFALLAAACAHAGGRGGAGDGPRTGIAGRVLLGPTCPVQRQDSPCPDQPFQGRVEARDGSGRLVAAVRSGAGGRFWLPLAPGTYEVRAIGHTGFPQVTRPVTVTVVQDQAVSVDLRVDTGIR